MYSKCFKRMFDFVLALLALLVLSPVILILTIVGAIAMGGNPFFVQPRPGRKDKNGREKIFNLMKFRTMSNKKDKDGKLLPDELRLNSYGRFLRSTSLDELGELWNIIKGDMSIVGPRPQLVRDMVFMTEKQRKRHDVRPGLTGLVGLGYVGMPIAVAFAKKGVDVIGFDLNKAKIDLYKNGIDPTKEVGNEAIKNSTVYFTSDEKDLQKAKFHIVAVPTPVNTDHTPDLTPVIGASEIVGRNLTKGSYVVFESTVYPGCTEDVCVPILERKSGLRCGVDFKVGYSPERINPGDKVHRLENIRKIVSGCDEEALETIKSVYDIVIEVGTYPVSNLRTAEAVKVVENSQRDINIAFMNELAMVFDRMDIDTNEVVDGMNTKWNALGFRPGLVGGHCIGVDPYYFTYQAEKLGYHSQIILNGRIVNDSMGKFVADAAIKNMIAVGQAPKKSKVVILGLTFKENCPDTRNSKVDDIIKHLAEYEIKPIVVDPWASERDAMHEYGVTLTKLEDVKDADCVIVAVAHNEFKALSLNDIKKLFRNSADTEKVLIDVKGLYNVAELKENGIKYWRL